MTFTRTYSRALQTTAHCRVVTVVTMETNTGEPEGSSEDITGKKKSKFKVLRTRLFGRRRRKETEGLMKQSQSASDVTTEGGGRGGDDSGDEFIYSPGVLGSRAMSHDSIFLADQSQAPVEPTRVLSQENVHGKIKALQMKLQQQNMHLGPPHLLIPGKRTEDAGASSEDDGLPHSPPETSFSLHEGLVQGSATKFPDTHRHHSSLSLAGTGSEEEEQGFSDSSSRPLSPASKPPTTPATPPGVDFDSPAQFTPFLDNSAARHRMAVKPRKQRASTKGRRLPSNDSRPRSESLNALDRPLPEKDEEEDCEGHKDVVRFRSYSTQVIRSGEALRDPTVGKLTPAPPLKPPEEYFGEVKTKAALWDSSDSRRLSQDPAELEGRVTTNPLFLWPMPQDLDSSWDLDADPGTRVAPSRVEELQKPFETVPEHITSKSPNVPQPHGRKDSVKEVLSNLKQRDTPKNIPMTASMPVTVAVTTTAKQLPVSEDIPAKAPSPQRGGEIESAAQTSLSSRDSLKRGVQGMSHEPLMEARSKPQPPVSLRTASTLMSVAQATASLKRSTIVTAEGAGKDGSHPERAQCVTVPPAGLDDQPTVEGVITGKRRPSSGSFRFSIASAWDRPRGGSLKGDEENKEAKSSMDNQEPQAKVEGNIAGKVLSIAKRQEQLAAMSEEAKHKDQPRTPVSFQERATAPGKEDVPQRGLMRAGGGGDMRQKRVAGEGGVGEGKESRGAKSGQVEEVREGDKEERATFGVKLRSTSGSTKYRQDVAKPELRSKRLSAEASTLGQPPDPQTCPQLPPPTKHPPPQMQQDAAARGSCPLREESKDRGGAADPCLKPPLLRKPIAQNNDSCTTPADSPSTSSCTPKCENKDKERPGDLKQGGPAPKPPSATPKEAEPSAAEPTWMTMAREKTRSLQQLFTSKLPRDFTVTMTTSSAAPTPKTAPQPAPTQTQTPRPAAQSAPPSTPQPPPQAAPQGRPDKAPQGFTEKNTMPQGRTERAVQMEKKTERVPPVESTAPPADKRTEKTERSFPMGGKMEPRHVSAATHVTASVAPHRSTGDGRSEAKTEVRLGTKNKTSEPASSTAPVQRREREDRQPMRGEATSLPSAVSSGGQPSWMELAKRKSLAWSDKTMD
ncbi:hypothetical protein JZ751_023575 [Albula glossodonta]|uniref:DUF4592 domain-containing protein n=1 Tax=Albula glossodonta TaxID=121402 RepID=A0A8T2NPE0_9TELE|nr:hypothetical protein JZ751_023575 [Albula glossodonta]